MDCEMSKHALDMLAERRILPEYLRLALDDPDWESEGPDGNVHRYKSIPEHGGRILHVVINQRVMPRRVITVFIDRRARRPE